MLDWEVYPLEKVECEKLFAELGRVAIGKLYLLIGFQEK